VFPLALGTMVTGGFLAILGAALSGAVPGVGGPLSVLGSIVAFGLSPALLVGGEIVRARWSA
jgi:hypothetical protein